MTKLGKNWLILLIVSIVIVIIGAVFLGLRGAFVPTGWDPFPLGLTLVIVGSFLIITFLTLLVLEEV